MGQISPDHKASAAERPEKTPAERLFEVFGAARVAAIAQLTTEAVRKWKRRRSTGGTGGLVPAQYQARFLAVSDQENRGLEPSDFIAEPWE